MRTVLAQVLYREGDSGLFVGDRSHSRNVLVLKLWNPLILRNLAMFLSQVRWVFPSVRLMCSHLVWLLQKRPCYVFAGPSQKTFRCWPVTHSCSLPLAEAELLDCEAKSDSSLEREPAEDDSKGADGGKKRKRKPYRPGRAPDWRRQLLSSVKWCSTCLMRKRSTVISGYWMYKSAIYGGIPLLFYFLDVPF